MNKLLYSITFMHRVIFMITINFMIEYIFYASIKPLYSDKLTLKIVIIGDPGIYKVGG